MKTITKAIRAVMHTQGKTCMYTNKYKKCRTVKVYGSISARAVSAIQDIAKRANKDITIKTISAMKSYHGGVATIVRVPGSSKRDNLFM